jgi:hypothetical protein
MPNALTAINRQSDGKDAFEDLTGGAGSAVFTTIEVDLGLVARRAGHFIITSSGLTIGKPVMIQKASGPYTGKGSRSDVAEFDLITATGAVISATEIEVFWQSQGPVRGNIKFNYLIGA